MLGAQGRTNAVKSGEGGGDFQEGRAR